jgi:hypothetical protein
MYKINGQHFTFVRMANLLPLLPNAMLLVKECQRNVNDGCAVVNLENNFSISAKFTDVHCNFKHQAALLICFLFDHSVQCQKL